MWLFVDNDVVLKLAKYELLLSFQDIVHKQGHRIFILESLPFVAGFNNSQRASKVFGDSTGLQDVMLFWERVERASIEMVSTFQLINSISDPNLDEGELTLLGCALESEAPGFCSGDKRAIKAADRLVSSQKLSIGHCVIIIMEHILQIILASIDVREVLEKILKKPGVDTAIRLCFQGASVDSIHEVVLALESYISDLKKHCPTLLFLEHKNQLP